MIQVFETVMTAILAYMVYLAFEGVASGNVLGVLVVVQVLFWALDFLFVRGGMDDIHNVRRMARRLAESASRA